MVTPVSVGFVANTSAPGDPVSSVTAAATSALVPGAIDDQNSCPVAVSFRHSRYSHLSIGLPVGGGGARGEVMVDLANDSSYFDFHSFYDRPVPDPRPQASAPGNETAHERRLVEVIADPRVLITFQQSLQPKPDSAQ